LLEEKVVDNYFVVIECPEIESRAQLHTDRVRQNIDRRAAVYQSNNLNGLIA
jgi:hypothetical protein